MSGLSLAVTRADGQVKRWGPDELNATDIPIGLSFSTSVPGGFKDLQCELLRRIDLDYSDQALFDTVQLLGPGNTVVWEGRMHAFPRSHGDGPSVTPQAVGWNAHLKDDPSFSMIYVDRDLGRWTGAARQRQIDLLAGSYTQADGPNVQPDTTSGITSLMLRHASKWAAPIRPIAEAWYDAGPGNLIGSVYFDIVETGAATAADAAWDLSVRTVTNDQGTTNSATTGDIWTSVPVASTLTDAAGARYGLISFSYTTTPSGADGYEYTINVRRLAVFGSHGLTTRGTAPDHGLYASDIVEHIVSAASPLLTYSTGVGGSIEPTTFVVPHLAFHDPVTAEDAILATNAFHLYEWGVWENREFFWRQPDPTRLCWEARLSDGAHLSLEGDQADDVYNGVFVRYNDPAGQTHTVGPPGSGAEATDTSLEDTSETNPVNQHGIPRKWARLDISQTTTQAGAIQLGAIFLREKSTPQRRGTLTLTGTVQHPTKGKRPVYEVRAGDYVRISDHPADVPRRIIETRVNWDTRTMTCTLDNSSQRLDAILERFGAALVGVI